MRRVFRPFLKKYIFFFSESVSLGSIPHHASEAVGVLLDLLGSLGNVVELFHFGIHHTLGHMVLVEGFGKLLP